MGPFLHTLQTWGSLMSLQHGTSVWASDQSQDCKASDNWSLNTIYLSTRSHGTHGRVAWTGTAWHKIGILGAKTRPSCHAGRNGVCPAHSQLMVCDQTVGGNSWARAPSPNPREFHAFPSCIARLGADPGAQWRSARQPTPLFLPKNPVDRGAWWATAQRVAKSRT